MRVTEASAAHAARARSRLLPRLAKLLQERDADLFAESALRLFWWSRPHTRVVDLATWVRDRGWSRRM
jgi:hypothetical protein